jgi:hypothetical protein
LICAMMAQALLDWRWSYLRILGSLAAWGSGAMAAGGEGSSCGRGAARALRVRARMVVMAENFMMTVGNGSGNGLVDDGTMYSKTTNKNLLYDAH